LLDYTEINIANLKSGNQKPDVFQPRKMCTVFYTELTCLFVVRRRCPYQNFNLAENVPLIEKL